MDEFFRQHLIDYFDAFELVEFLGVTTEELLETELLEQKVEEHYEELAERIGYRSTEDDE